MLSRKSVRNLGVLLCLLVSSIGLTSENSKKQPVEVGLLIYNHEEMNEVRSRIYSVMKHELERNARLSQKPVFEIHVNFKRMNPENDGPIILSVLTTMKLPDEVIELGKKNEIFYSIFGSKEKWGDLPKEGKTVREYVTEEFLRQYCDIYDFNIYIVPETKLQEQCKKIVDDFFSKVLRVKPEEP